MGRKSNKQKESEAKIEMLQKDIQLLQSQIMEREKVLSNPIKKEIESTKRNIAYLKFETNRLEKLVFLSKIIFVMQLFSLLMYMFLQSTIMFVFVSLFTILSLIIMIHSAARGLSWFRG